MLQEKVKNFVQNETVKQVAKSIVISIVVGMTTQLVVYAGKAAVGYVIDRKFDSETGIDEIPTIE